MLSIKKIALGVRKRWQFSASACAAILISPLVLETPSAAQNSQNTVQLASNPTQSVRSETQTDIAFIVDVSSEMNGDTLDKLKSAAKSFVEANLSPAGRENTTRIALVPFSEGVRVPKPIFDRVALPGPESRHLETKAWHWYYGWRKDRSVVRKTRCLSERAGLDAYTDAEPSSQHRVSPVYSRESICNAHSKNQMSPLSNDRAQLMKAIAELHAEGDKATQVGLAWGWYALSPKWRSIWAPTPAQSRRYDAAQARKIAVLVSGGKSPVQFSTNGVATRVSKSSNGHARRQIRRLCRNMKAAGVSLYTVALNAAANSPVTRTLTACATAPDQALRVDTADDLKAALRSIARTIQATDKPST